MENIIIEQEPANLIFLKSYDFMKLGQAIEHGNWQVAAMTSQRMQKAAQELDMDMFVRQLTNIRQCIMHRQGKAAKDILALMVARRAQMLNELEKSRDMQERQED